MEKIKNNHKTGARAASPLQIALFTGIVALVLGAAVWLLKSELWPVRPPLDETALNVIDVEADMAGFSLDVIKAKVGQPITIRLTSHDNPYHMDGGGQHQWAVDELDVSIIAPPEGSSSATFTPGQAGTYVYYCDICCGGRANPAMRGELIVES